MMIDRLIKIIYRRRFFGWVRSGGGSEVSILSSIGNMKMHEEYLSICCLNNKIKKIRVKVYKKIYGMDG